VAVAAALVVLVLNLVQTDSVELLVVVEVHQAQILWVQVDQVALRRKDLMVAMDLLLPVLQAIDPVAVAEDLVVSVQLDLVAQVEVVVLERMFTAPSEQLLAEVNFQEVYIILVVVAVVVELALGVRADLEEELLV
jgi:hypothetical protein